MDVQRRQYTAEFKQEAVRLVEEGGLSLSQAAQRLGVNRNLLAKWQRHLAVAHAAQAAGRSGYAAFPGQGRAHDEELARLRRENAALKMERDVLKKPSASSRSHPTNEVRVYPAIATAASGLASHGAVPHRAGLPQWL